jgi:hypothetical protein
MIRDGTFLMKFSRGTRDCATVLDASYPTPLARQPPLSTTLDHSHSRLAHSCASLWIYTAVRASHVIWGVESSIGADEVWLMFIMRQAQGGLEYLRALVFHGCFLVTILLFRVFNFNNGTVFPRVLRCELCRKRPSTYCLTFFRFFFCPILLPMNENV